MKTCVLFFLLVLTVVTKADQWFVNGVTYNGTIHRLNADKTQAWVTSDWDNYGGSWVRVAYLDVRTRVRLGVGTAQERADIQKADEQAAVEAKARAEREAAERAERAQAERDRKELALREREVRAKEREASAMERQSRAAAQRSPAVQIIVPSGYGYPRGYSHHRRYGYPPRNGLQMPVTPGAAMPSIVPTTPVVPSLTPVITIYGN